MTVERPVEIELKYAVADRAIGERLLNAETLAGFRLSEQRSDLVEFAARLEQRHAVAGVPDMDDRHVGRGERIRQQAHAHATRAQLPDQP